MTIYTDINKMRIRSATTIAIMGLRYLEGIVERDGFGKRFDAESKKLLRTRPTAVVMHNAIKRVQERPQLEEIDKTIAFLKNAKNDIARNGARLFKKGKKLSILTHCESTETVELFRQNKKFIKKIFVTETRPFYQGMLTAKDTSGSKINTNLIIDSAIGYYIDQVDMVVVGADAIRREGIVNKIGTLPLAVLAKEYGKPFYVAANTYKMDDRKSYSIEMRDPDEIHKPIKGINILNPVFDVTPWKYVTKVVTEDGIFSPGRIRGMI